MLNFLNEIQVSSHYLATSIGGVLAFLGVVVLLKLTRNRIAYFKKDGEKMKKVKFNLTQPVKPNSESEEKVNEKLAIPVHSETELEKLECPFTKKLTECPFSQNNEKIKKMELSPEESEAEQEYRKGQLDTIFKLLKEQEAARLNSKNDSHLFEKIPKFSRTKQDDEYKFSVLNHETLQYTPVEEEELETELESIFSSQMKLYGRDGEMDSYREAYVSLCLPKILGPLIRLKYVNWNPLEDSSYDFEKEDWFKACVMYGKAGDNEKAISEDIDIRLIPTLIEKIFLPKITMLIEQYWDPMSTTQTLKLVRLISRLTRDYPSIRPTCRQLRTLFQMLLDKIKTAIDNDMFIPVFPKQITESKGSFFQRQFCGGLKLFRNILSWQGIVADTALRDLAINSLLNRYLLSAMRVCSPMDAATKASMIVYTLPRVWLNNSTEILPNLEMFIVLLKNIQLQLDKKNQVHLESMEKIDNILTSLHVAM